MRECIMILTNGGYCIQYFQLIESFFIFAQFTVTRMCAICKKEKK